MELDRLIVATMGAISICGIAYAIFYPYLSNNARADKRKKALEQHEPKLSRVANSVNRRDQVAQSLKEMEQRENSRNKKTLENIIAQAGLDWSRRKFSTISAIMGISVAVVLFFLTTPLMGLIGLFVGYFGLPRWIVSYMSKRRMNKFIDEFPNALDIIIRGIRSGLPLGDCLRVISMETSEPVRSEFRRIVEAQSLGMNVGDACAKLYERVPVAESNFFAIVIQVQQKSGGNLSEVLTNLSKVLRDRRKMKAKVDAISMEAKASAGIIGSLPILVGLFVWLLSPQYLELLWTREYGKIALVIGAMMMFSGILVMRKMINFEI